MSEWKNFCLGDVCNTISETYRRKSERVTLINTSDVLNGKILNHDSVPNKNLKGQFKKTFQKDDILFSEIRPINRRCAFVDFENTQDYIASTKLMVLRAKKEEILPRYLYFFLTSENVLRELQHLAETRSGTFPQITFDSELASFPISLPPLETQKKIAAVLSALDDKIELNNAINKNLEEQILTLYLNSLEDNKCVTNELRNFCSFQEGYVNPKQGHAEFFNGEIKWLRAVDVNESYVISTTRTLTKAGYESAGKSAVFFEPDTIAISKSGTIGRLGIVGDYMCGNRAVINVKPKQKFLLPFIYAYLKASRKTFIDFAVGSVQKNLYVSILEPLTVKIPSQEILLNFCKIAGDNLELIKVNCFENQKLGELRDALLPKLMSGEIDVSEVEI